MDEKLIAAGLLEALEDADIDLRYRMPEIFERVDEIKHRPEWLAFSHFSHVVGPERDTLRFLECAWCGDDFVSEKSNGRWHDCCSRGCSNSIRIWRRRRAA